MKEIGGYFELERPNVKTGLHEESIKLNTARNCFEYVLLAREYVKVYIPYYTCDVILEPLVKHNIEYAFYNINADLEPVDLPELKGNEAFLYTNYFGIKGNFVKSLVQTQKNIIIDNSQALFEPNIDGIDTFYSLRKFIGTPDGAFAYCGKGFNTAFDVAVSHERVSHLYKRREVNAAYGYEDFKKNDSSLTGLPIMKISASTADLITGYDFEKNKVIRERNFLYLHNQLGKINQLKISLNDIKGPLCYPFMSETKDLKERLIKNKVLVPTYWPNVRGWVKSERAMEHKLTELLVCLPIDQRYDFNDLEKILSIIEPA